MAYQLQQNRISKEDMKGKIYGELIDLCFKYSQYFSLTFLHIRQGVNSCTNLDKAEFSFFRTKNELWYPYGQDATVKIYHCTDETKAFLLQHVNNLFAWEAYDNHNPEDLAFFREDGTGFFELITHEGMATIYNRKNEAVPSLFQQEPWRYYDYGTNYVAAVWTAKHIRPWQTFDLSPKQKEYLRLVRQTNINKKGNPYKWTDIDKI